MYKINLTKEEIFQLIDALNITKTVFEQIEMTSENSKIATDCDKLLQKLENIW